MSPCQRGSSCISWPYAPPLRGWPAERNATANAMRCGALGLSARHGPNFEIAACHDAGTDSFLLTAGFMNEKDYKGYVYLQILDTFKISSGWLVI